MGRSLSAGIKRAAMDAADNAQLCDLRFGTVVSTSPLKVKITNLLTLPESVLIVPRHLTDYEVDVTIDWNTENHTHTHNISDTYTGGGSASDNTHKHEVSGRKSMKVHSALQVDDKVALIRKQGGQSYYILDRI